MEEQFCRICRGEATPDDPLFYPCKCRGSIKYIHQGCLEEWLKHSGRDPSCDICHVKYKFTTQFKEDTPDRVPLKLIFVKFKDTFVHLFRYGLTISGLLFGVLIQIPLFWKAASRLFTWIIDGAMPHEDFLISLIYGELQVEGDPYELSKIASALTSSYFDSLSFLLTWIPIHLILFLEHEWVSRDPGFKTLILKKIGPAETIVNVARPTNLRHNVNDPEYNERMLREVQNLQVMLENRNHPQNQAIQDALRVIEQRQNALQRERRNELRRRNNEDELLDEEDEDQDPDFEPRSGESSDNESDDTRDEDDLLRPERLDRLREQMRRFDHQIEHEPELDDQRPIIPFPNALAAGPPNAVNPRRQIQEPIPARVWEAFHEPPRPNEQPAAPNAANAPILPNIDQEAAAALAAERRQAAQARGAAAAAVAAVPQEDDDVLLSLPIYMIIVGGDAFLAVYLFIAYFVPSGFGNLIFYCTALLANGILAAFNKFLIITGGKEGLNRLFDLAIETKDKFPITSEFIIYYFISPVITTLDNVYRHKLPQSTIERIIPLSIFYGAIYSGILYYLSSKTKKHSRNNPLLGFERKLFVLLLDLVCTFKVFLIFAIELVFFPMYCGFLLELSLTPIFSYDTALILSKVFFIKDYMPLTFFVYWAAGTLYMCLFALFVGMTRKFILRPGVLFFIRSPEDPNARLIHDALVRPFGLQISRIALSGFVYTLFILIGFGAVTQLFKLTGSSVLPLDLKSLSGVFFVNFIVYTVREQMDLIKKYVRQYWIRAFRITSKKLKLSSFILGKHDSRERGYVLYRNLKAQLEGAKPDYTEPKSRSQAKELFKTTDVRAVFIPDGNLVRAPKHDTVSRKFVRKLFIPVSKDDKPLKSINDSGLDKVDEKYPLDEFDDSEDELTTTNQYEIVYRPPYFGTRIVLFLAMLWIFAALLIVSAILTANICGKPFTYLIQLFFNVTKEETFKWSHLYSNLGQSGISLYQLDTTSLAVGSQIVIHLLAFYDNAIQKRHIQIMEGEDVVGEAGNDNGQQEAAANHAANEDIANVLEQDLINAREQLRREQANGDNGYGSIARDVWKFILITGSIFSVTAFFFISVCINIALCVSAHINAIESPYRHFYGKGEIDYTSISFHLDYITIPLHLLLASFTFIPFLMRFRPDVSKILREGPDEVLTFKNVFKRYALPIISRLISVEMIVILVKIGITLNEYFEHSFQYTSLRAAFYYILVQQAIYKDTLIYLWSIIIGINVAVRLSFKGYELFKKINEQIKEEYYTTGKTLENSENSEETTPSS
ncbi:putative membrane protein [Wickerhamomyces ciferrii]|uniref:RING-type E3 ubiquitin transferase n=1 Tax=Wickerhamomyces ciferrii (strain ATCC 14091 / BCRC 22168 / CBS 111 / JCM 3599 / NBRC 0793 / NRRL Y-1031 F-60-10) TaxID=1206466 RepID=K0KGW2_WICCF|nr:uncharacterized protein BN7_1760 [Wickerhamomyces ciferrii]CCH42216.1 putative membrane protein [Wickerhamomyces ciferrii]